MGGMAMSRLSTIALAGVWGLLAAGCATEATVKPPWFDGRVDELVAPTLRKFRSAAEFDAYRASLWRLGNARGAYWARNEPFAVGSLMASTGEAAPCDPSVDACRDALAEIQVTGSRIVKPSITNNQEAGVDEGDIVKQFGRFLIVLHDGRLFSIDTGAPSATMALVDRVDVYRSPDDDAWYDELLIDGDELVVTGYSYELDASQLSVFRLAPDGVFTALATYYITSDDYYSDDNYASRLVDGNLVLYTPLFLTDVDPDDAVAFPRIRRWTAESGFSEWQPLFGPTDVYGPIQRTLDPVVHTISVCPVEADREWQCRSTGLVGPAEREFYVSPQHAFVWLATSRYDVYNWNLEACSPGVTARAYRPLPAALYRIPLAGGSADAVLTAGAPVNQFGLDARDDEFLALLAWAPGDCDGDDDAYSLEYTRIPNAAFGVRPGRLDAAAYTELPKPRGDDIENRFTDDYLVYAGSRGRWSYRGDDVAATTDLVAVPVHRPAALSALPLEHSGERLEVFGDNVVVDGYHTTSGLSVSTVDLRGRPAVAGTAYLEQVMESEGRSHAFNWIAAADGSGMFGVPTMFKSRSSWNTPSNLHFFTVDSTLALHPAGYLEGTRDAEDKDYECDVSCVDWYGNARPIFMDGRIFALTGVELIEGYVSGGQILERQRVNMTGVPLHVR